MIPFLKKNKDGKKPPKPTVLRTAQESIPFQRMFEDGTCRVRPGYYTRTIQYQDINYQLAQQEDKTAIFEEWCSFLNFFDSSIHFELSFVNTATDSADFEKSIRIPYQQDGFDDVRAEYSQMLRQQLSKGNNGLTKTKFLTYGIEGDSMETTFHDGETVCVQQTPCVEVGEIGVFWVDGCGYIKELGNGCLISHNSSYDPIPLQGTENRCIGRVLGTADVIDD